MAGLFITFEGGEGAGKSTQATLLAQAFTQRGYRVITTREPGGTHVGASIRQMLLHGEDVDPRAEALLFAADRAHHVAKVIRPALEDGSIVICDRYMDSSVAYQGGARSLNPKHIRAISLWAVQGLLPDLTVLLDLPVDEGLKRAGNQPDRMESQGQRFHERVRVNFLKLAHAEQKRFTVIDASLPVQEIAERVWNTAQALLPGRDLANDSYRMGN